MKNQVIKCLTPEHGKKIIEYWKSKGVDTKGLEGNNSESDNNYFIYYGVINGRFANYSLSHVKITNAEIIELPEEKAMETQRLSRQGLKEIHSVACSNWKTILEKYGANNPLEDYIELTQPQVDTMFNSFTKEQLPIVSKYLKQDDGSVDLTKITGGFRNENDVEIIAIRTGNEYANKSFWLHSNYKWEIKKDSGCVLCLIPTKKK